MLGEALAVSEVMPVAVGAALVPMVLNNTTLVA